MKLAHSLVEDLLKDLQLDLARPRRKSLSQWSSVVGERIAANTIVAGWEGETVNIRTSVPGIAMELKYRSSEIIGELNRIAEADVFTSLKVSLGPVREKERH